MYKIPRGSNSNHRTVTDILACASCCGYSVGAGTVHCTVRIIRARGYGINTVGFLVCRVISYIMKAGWPKYQNQNHGEGSPEKQEI